MKRLKVDNLPAWTEGFRRRDWFQYVAPLFIEEYEWHDKVCNDNVDPGLIRWGWEKILRKFCLYITWYTISKNIIKGRKLKPYNPPKGSLNWLIDNIHGVESARRAFEHFVKPDTYMGQLVFVHLLDEVSRIEVKEATQQGESWDVHFWLYDTKNHK